MLQKQPEATPFALDQPVPCGKEPNPHNGWDHSRQSPIQIASPMPEQFIFIPGSTSRQGTALNEGKYTDEIPRRDRHAAGQPQDMQRMSLKEGDKVRVWSDLGQIVVPIKASKGDELPAGMLFISYGMQSCQLMGGETHGTRMPDSKCMDVWMEKSQD